jgi:translocation and assembly module TamB
VRKWLLLSLLVLLLIAAPAVLVGVLVYTEQGVRWIEPRLTALQKFGVYFEGISGTLAGPLKIARFELEHKVVHIEAFDIEIRTEPWQLLGETIRGTLKARDVLVEVYPNDEPPSPRPLRFLPQFLRIDVDGDVQRVRYVNPDGTTFSANRLQAGVLITPSRVGVRRFEADAPLFKGTGNLRLVAQRPLGLELEAQGQFFASDKLTVDLKTQLDGTIDELGIKVLVEAPSRVNADLKLTRPEKSWRIAGKLDSPDFSLRPWLEEPPFTLRNIALTVDAAPGVVRVAGNLLIPELDARPVRVKANGNFAARVLTIKESELALAESPARAQVGGTITFTKDDQLLDLSTQWRNLQYPLRGSALVTSSTGSAELRGPLPYDFTLTGQVAGPDVPSSQASARGVLTKEQVRFADYQITTLDGTVQGRGELQFAAPRAWSLQANAAKLNPASLDARFPGRLSFQAAGSGRGLDTSADFNVTVRALEGELRKQAVRGSGRIERTPRSWRVDKVQLDYGNARLAADGTLAGTWQNRARARVDLRWSLQAQQLQQLWPDTTGAIDFNGSAVGPLDRPHIITTLQASDAGYGEWRAQRVAVDADLDVAAGARSRLQIDAKGIRSAEPWLDDLSISGNGTAEQHALEIKVSGHAERSADTPRAHLKLAASYLNELWSATISSSELNQALGYERLNLAEPARLVVGKDRLTLESLCFVIGNGRLCGNGNWERGGPWEGVLAGYEIPVASVLPPQDEAEYGGRVEGRVRAFGVPGKPWQAEAGMRIIDASVTYTPKGAEPQTLNLGTGGLGAAATSEQVTFSFGVQAFTDTFIYANARIQRNGSNDILNLPLRGDIRARAADANILPILVTEIDNAAGLLTANLDLTGSLAAPQIEGRIALQNGAFDSYRVNLALRDLNLAAQLSGNRVNFNGSGIAGEGSLQVSGGFGWQGGTSRGELRLKGQNLLVADLPEYRVVASPDLQFKVDGERIEASGEVNIPSARIAPAQLKGAVQVSEDARYLGETAAERDGRIQLSSDIRITMGDDVRLDSFGLQGAISGSVATNIATGRTPTGRGELRVLDGRYEAYGQKLAINRGRLLFEASPLDDPGLDIDARRKVEAVEVGLNVRGTLQQPRLSFFSEPSMPQSQIVAYLVVGKPLDEMQGGDRSTVTSARDALTSQGGGLLASRLGRRLGLEEVGVENKIDSAGVSNTSLVLGKFLSPRLFISYGISLTESINTLKLRYTISDRFILKTESGDNQSADVEFTIER